MIKIREAKESDTLALEQLFMVVRQQIFIWENPENFKIGDFTKSTKGEKIFVAEKDNSLIIGFISLWDLGESFIHNLFVRPDFQRIGVGKNLLKEVIGITPRPITLKVVTHNIQACKFYEKQGWKKVSTDESAILPYHVYCYES